jgi:DNA-binding winged helix-turn-helix (wHTH) protein
VSAAAERQVLAFGEFFLDATQRLLFRADGEPVALVGRAFDTLLFMVEHPVELLDKKTLMHAIWPDVIVEENNLSQNIFIVRRALGEAAGEHRLIVTVPGRAWFRAVRRLDAIPPPGAPAELQRAESQPASSAGQRRQRSAINGTPASTAGGQRSSPGTTRVQYRGRWRSSAPPPPRLSTRRLSLVPQGHARGSLCGALPVPRWR